MENKTLPTMYTANDVKTILKCGNKTLYELLARRDFPSIKVGNKYLIPEKDFFDWLKKESKYKNT